MANRSGFTVVEVVVAIVVLSVGVLALASAAGQTMRLIGQGRRLTAVAALGREQLESLRRAGCPGTGAGVITRGRIDIQWMVTSGPGGRGVQTTLMIQSPGVAERLPFELTNFIAEILKISVI